MKTQVPIISVILVLIAAHLVTPALAANAQNIIVDTTSDVADFGGAQQVADLPGPDGFVSLREAIIALAVHAGKARVE